MSQHNQHIAFFIGSISQGAGTERITTALANRLINCNYKVSIISLWNGQHSFFPLNDNIQCHTLLKSSKRITSHFYSIIKHLASIVNDESISILVNVDVILALFSLPLKLSNLNVKIISWEHFNFRTNLGIKRRDWARRMSIRYADMIITLTAQDKALYQEVVRKKFPICNIPNFIEGKEHRPANIVKKNILAVGRLTFQKGFDLLLDIWKEASSIVSDKEWKLIIVGNGEDINMLIKRAQILNITDRVEFVGEQKEVTKYYENASIYAMTSRFEGLPMVLIEALNHGLPIISYDCLTGPRDIIENEFNGYLIPIDEKALFINRMVYLMENIDIRQKMQTAALIKKQEFSPDTIIEKWIKLFDIL